MTRMKVALCQTRVTGDKALNLARAEARIVEAARKGAQLVALPEMFNCPYASEYFRPFAEPVPSGPACRALSGLAKKLKIFVAGGSIPELDGKKVYNTATVFDPHGRLVARHRKVHLFDVTLKGIRMRESATLSPGNKVTVFNTPFGPMGLLVCYDARFPEMFRLMLKKGITSVLMPGAFSVVTGTAHWKTLIKMRAVDYQIFMAAISPARQEKAIYRAFGHSMITDPWGDTLVLAGTGETTVFGVLDPKRLRDIRARLPLLKHRRRDLY